MEKNLRFFPIPSFFPNPGRTGFKFSSFFPNHGRTGFAGSFFSPILEELGSLEEWVCWRELRRREGRLCWSRDAAASGEEGPTNLYRGFGKDREAGVYRIKEVGPDCLIRWLFKQTDTKHGTLYY